MVSVCRLTELVALGVMQEIPVPTTENPALPPDRWCNACFAREVLNEEYEQVFCECNIRVRTKSAGFLSFNLKLCERRLSFFDEIGKTRSLEGPIVACGLLGLSNGKPMIWSTTLRMGCSRVNKFHACRCRYLRLPPRSNPALWLTPCSQQ